MLLPGPTDSWRSYQPVLERLPPSVHAVAVSMRGHGDSDKPETGYRVQDYAADVIDLLDAVGLERAVLTGHSGSCLVARRVALDRPERVAGLVLEASPTTLRGDARLQELVESVVSGLEDPIGRDFARSFVSDTSSGNVTPELLDQLVDEVVKVPARVWKQTFGAAGGLRRHGGSAADRCTNAARVGRPRFVGPARHAGPACANASPRPSWSSTPGRGTRHVGMIRRASALTCRPSSPSGCRRGIDPVKAVDGTRSHPTLQAGLDEGERVGGRR